MIKHKPAPERSRTTGLRFHTSSVVVATLCGLVLVVSTHLKAATFVGADEWLRLVAEQSESDPTKERKEGDSAIGRWVADLKAAQDDLSAPFSEEAAARWLRAAERMAEIPGEDWQRAWSDETIEGDPVALLFDALPAPEHWPVLIAKVEEQIAQAEEPSIAQKGLHLLVLALENDRKKLESFNREITAGLSGADRNSSLLAQIVVMLEQRLALRSRDPDVIFWFLEKQVNRGENAVRHSSGELPELVGLVGAERAEQLLRKMLVKPGGLSITIYDSQTAELARNLAIELIDELKSPPWGLAASPEGGPLFEALEQKFNESQEEAVNDPLNEFYNSSNMGYERQRAEHFYLVQLVAEDRTQEAMKRIKAMAGEEQASPTFMLIDTLAQSGQTRSAYGILKSLAEEDPEHANWEGLIRLGALTGNSGEAKTLVRQALDSDQLKPAKRVALRETLVDALLADNQLDQAAQSLSDIVAARSGDVPGPQDWVDSAMRLAELGLLVNNSEWVDRGLPPVLQHLEGIRAQELDHRSNGLIGRVSSLLVELDRAAEAEHLLINIAAKTRRLLAAPEPHWQAGSQHQNALATLAEVYDRAGRHEDVLILLERAPHWGAADLAQLPEPLGVKAARALLRTGRQTEARAIVEHMLPTNLGNDRLYELLVELGGDAAMTRLEQLIKLDRFEERPLIWKAVLLRRSGDLSQAEELLKEAINIDPSDGEQGKGDRMRAYAALAEVHAAQGKNEDAEFLKGVVEAIRLAEDADDFYEAGLLKRAITMYEESLGHFSDAYCIQSRLALRYAELGLTELAEKHYQKAYELMPDSFGRVESHCFGCEGAFQGRQAQLIAGGVFARLARERPEDPQVQYLLGYLRMAQDRHDEAAKNFLRAVELDPDYLNAWSKLNELRSRTVLESIDSDAITLNLLRLDPLGRQTYLDVSAVADLAALWKVAAENVALTPPPAEQLLPLPASARTTKQQTDRFSGRESYHSYGGQDRGSLKPARLIQDQELVSSAKQLISNDLMRMEYW